MARTYKRDSKGRFAGGGGGGSGGSGGKAASTRGINTARAKTLRAKGTVALGSRVKAKGFAGGKGAQQRAGGLRMAQQIALKRKPTSMGAGTRAGLKANAAAVAKARSRAASKGVARTSKAPMSAAKAQYKALSGAARKASPFRSASENRAAAGARRRLSAMVARRGRRR